MAKIETKGEFRPNAPVRITVEGDWTSDEPTELILEHFDLALNDDDKVTVEYLEPPVERFQPGDVVRHKTFGSVYAITTGGFVLLSGDGAAGTYHNYTFDKFTSDYYDKVAI